MVERDPLLDITYDCNGYDADGNPYKGRISFDFGISAELGSHYIDAGKISFDFGLSATSPVPSQIVIADTISFNFGLSAEVVTTTTKAAFVSWSKMNLLDFTKDRSNVAGKTPLDWSGTVTNIFKVNGKPVALGDNGVTIMTPHHKLYGVNTIHRVGLINRDAVAGNEFVLFFVDAEGYLYQLTDTIKKLDFSEWLSGMTGLVATYDEVNQLLYLCDGTNGYVYNPVDQSMGKGPATVTGIAYKDDTFYIVAPGSITIPGFEIWSDIWDFGTRRTKTLYSLEVGTNLTETMQAAIAYRDDKSQSFTTTGWYNVDPAGMAYIPCTAREFKFGLKVGTYEYFEIDYIMPTGEINAW